VAAVEDLFLRDGAFEIGGAGLETLLGSYSTPLYVYSGHMIDAEYDKVRSLFPGFDIIYSLKANPGLAICARLRSRGGGADVSSLGELQTALKAGFGPENIFFVGPAKAGAELAFAVETGIYAVIVESARELVLIDKLASERSKRQRVLLRINTSESPSSAEVMVGGPTKFGFDEEAVVKEVRALELSNVDISGIHVYSASQVLDEEFIRRHIEHVLKLALHLSAELGFPLGCIDFGGGFGVPYSDDEKELDLPRIAERTGELVGASASRLEGCRLVFELGRFLVARSGVFLTRVLEVKKSRGRLFVLTDGGMNTFTRPVFMGVRHPVRVVNKMGQRVESEYDVCGPICTPIDCIGRNVMLPHVEPGDVIGVFNAGAYGYTMSLLNFMSLGWPAEVMVENGKANLIRQPRAAEALLDDQVTPSGPGSL
jgi:diaminopimelate decarboxylase